MKKKNYQKPTIQVLKIQKRLLQTTSDPGPGGGNAPEFIGDFDEEC